MMLPLVLLIQFILLLIIFQVSFSFNLLGDFHQNFSHQNFFSLAMATKMVAAWSTVMMSHAHTLFDYNHISHDPYLQQLPVLFVF